MQDSEFTWLFYANTKVNALIKDNSDVAALASKQKRVIKFVKKTILPLRVTLQEQAESEKNY